MLFSTQLSLPSLIALCRALHHQLEAGITVAEVFQQQAGRGPGELRGIALRIYRQLQEGNSLTSALKNESAFPPLFVALASVGEETGHLAEVFGSLEEYYLLQQKLERNFRSQITGPVIQFVAAVLIITLVIWILGVLSSGPNSVGGLFGLSGLSGALTFLGSIVGLGLFFYLAYKYLASALQGKVFMDAVLLKLPGIGPCLHALAMGRLTLALHLTLDSGMSILKAMRLSLQATGNAAFAAQADAIEKELRAGESLTMSLTGIDILSDDFRNLLATAEKSGRIPEVMRQQTRFYHEEAVRRLTMLVQVAAWGVWLAYAIFIIIMIFQLASIYFNALNI